MDDLEVVALAEGISAPAWPLGFGSTGCCTAASLLRNLCAHPRGFGVRA